MTQAPSQPRVVSGLQPAEDSQPSSRPAAVPLLQLDKRTYARALDCVHCGLCLPACPTYTQNGLEADSPRGRIVLMKGLAEGKVDPTESVLRHLDLCLDCRACETACPSGVVYHELIEETRTRLADKRPKTLVDRFVETMFLHVFTRPWRLKLALLPVRVLQRIGVWNALAGVTSKVLPPQLDKMQRMLPPHGPVWESNLAARYPAKSPQGVKKATVGFLPGCVGSVLFQDVNRKTIALLQHAGCDVIVPKAVGCCGAIHHHSGHAHPAEDFARDNINAFFPLGTDKPNVDYIVNNIAGCGAMLKDYAHLLRDDAVYAERAKAVAKRVRDISELLVELKPALPERTLDRVVTYHDACHLAHGQKVTAPPREVLSWIRGLKVVPLRESEMCCGAAGTYNLTEPGMATQLAERKINHIKATGARVCVTANVGCAMQIQSEAARAGVELHVSHPVVLLHEAYFGN